MTRAPFLTALCLAAFAVPALAQDAPAPDPVEAAASPVSALIVVEALEPVLDETGRPTLDASGQPVLAFQPVADGSALLPGSEFRYLVTLASSGPEAEALEIGLDVPAAGRLLPETVTASVEAGFEVGSTADATLREPLFVEQDGARIPNPDWAASPESFDRLFVTIDRIAPGASATVTYHLVVR